MRSAKERNKLESLLPVERNMVDELNDLISYIDNAFSASGGSSCKPTILSDCVICCSSLKNLEDPTKGQQEF